MTTLEINPRHRELLEKQGFNYKLYSTALITKPTYRCKIPFDTVLQAAKDSERTYDRIYNSLPDTLQGHFEDEVGSSLTHFITELLWHHNPELFKQQ